MTLPDAPSRATGSRETTTHAIAPLRRRSRFARAWAAARALDGGVRNPGFRALVHLIDRGPLHAAPTPRFLTDGAEAFACMHDAIAAAREEVLLETYIMRDDRIGERMRAALAAAAARGVRVSVLADAYGSFSTGGRFWEALTEGGVELRRFHRFWHHPLDVLRRDHRKLLVVDRTVAYTGGMNIGEEYGSSVRHHADAWRDTLVEVRGAVVGELAAVFAEGWERARGPALPGLEYVSWSEGVVLPADASPLARLAPMRRLRLALARQRDRRLGRRVLRTAPSGAATSGASPRDAAGGEVLVLDPRPGRAQRETLLVLAALVGAARERLWITTPYFAPPTRALRLLASAARRGVDVRLLLPGARTDVPLVRHAAHGAYAWLLAHGVRIFEYQRATLHAKTLVVDGHAGLVGSSNLDFRSFWLNAECNLLTFDDRAGAALESAFLTDVSDSDEVSAAAWRARGWAHRLGDTVARALRWAL